MAREDLDRLRRKLSTLEPTIKQLLSLKKQTIILEKKLTQLEDWIIDIPLGHEEFAQEWREKLANWWRLYAEAGSSPMPPKKSNKSLMMSGASSTKRTFDDVDGDQGCANNNNHCNNEVAICNSITSAATAKFAPFSNRPNQLYGHGDQSDEQLVELSKNFDKLHTLWKQFEDSGSCGASTSSAVECYDRQQQEAVPPRTPQQHIPMNQFGMSFQASNGLVAVTRAPGVTFAVDDDDRHDLLEEQMAKSDNKMVVANWWRNNQGGSPGREMMKSPPGELFTSSNSNIPWWHQSTSNLSEAGSTISPIVGFPLSKASPLARSMSNLARPARPAANSPVSIRESSAAVAVRSLEMEDSVDVKLSKNLIRSRLEANFAPLAKVTQIGDDSEGFKAVLNVVIKADNLIAPYWRDNRLQADVLSHAFRKLPDDSLQAFLNHHKPGSPKTVRDLRHFLTNELNSYRRVSAHNKVVSESNNNSNNQSKTPEQKPKEQPQTVVEAAPVANSTNGQPDVTTTESSTATKAAPPHIIRFCAKCKSTGHTIADCTARADPNRNSQPTVENCGGSSQSLFCFDCFKPGHTLSMCPNRNNNNQSALTSSSSDSNSCTNKSCTLIDFTANEKKI